MSLSVVLPTLNVAAALPATLAALRRLPDEIVVCDGGSRDGTASLAATLGARVVTAPRGRGGQLAAGIQATRGDWLLLLHADTVLAQGWAEAADRFMAGGGDGAGYFRFALASTDPRARLLERLVAWRCRTLALPYGDQGLLIARALLDKVGGVRDLPMLEDVDLARRLGRRRLVALDAAAVTSPARWERDGWVARSARNLLCVSLYFGGVPPRIIAALYS